MTTTESYGCDKHGEEAYQGCAMCDLETLRERLHEAELVAASWKREAELNEQAANESSGYAERLAALERGGVCIWCGEALDLTGKDMASAVEWARKHDFTCPDNPLRSRLATDEYATEAGPRCVMDKGLVISANQKQNQLVDCPACNLGNPGVYMKDGRMVCPHTPKAAHRDDCIAKSIGGPCNADCAGSSAWTSDHMKALLKARLADLEAERALIVARAENAEAALAYAASTGDECAIEVEALRKDAERWRWALVHGFPFISLDSHNYRRDVWVHGKHQCLTANAAIDAAMGESHE